MTSAFERVAHARGTDAPRERRANLHVVPDDYQPESVQTVSHRPVRFSEIIGQPELIMRLETHLKSAVARNAQPGHILLDGGPGLGKTTIAQALATEMAERGLPSTLHVVTAEAVRTPRKLALEMAKVRSGDVFFIDEIHALKPDTQVSLLRVMEDGVMFVEGDAKSPAIRFDAPPFTLVAATTNPGKLSAPVRDRFRFVGHLLPYEPEDMQLILLSYGEKIGIKDDRFDLKAAEIIARAARYVPRRGTTLVDAVRDYAFEVTGDMDAPIDADTALLGLEYAGVDEFGLDARDRAYLTALVDTFLGGPIGVDALAAVLGEKVKEIRETVEPYLLKSGLVLPRQTGRCATKATYLVLGKEIPPVLNSLR